MTSLARLLVCLASVTAAACTATLPIPPAQGAPPRSSEPVPVQREELDPSTGTVIHSWSEILLADGRVVKHGAEHEWYPDGTPRSEREFDHGSGTGRWRTWHANCVLASDYTFGPSGEATTMSFFHDAGDLAAQGPALAAIKTGAWTYWYASGGLESQGEYVNGRREGPWSFWDEDGVLAASGTMRHDRRVGTWVRRGASRGEGPTSGEELDEPER